MVLLLLVGAAVLLTRPKGALSAPPAEVPARPGPGEPLLQEHLPGGPKRRVQRIYGEDGTATVRQLGRGDKVPPKFTDLGTVANLDLYNNGGPEGDKAAIHKAGAYAGSVVGAIAGAGVGKKVEAIYDGLGDLVGTYLGKGNAASLSPQQIAYVQTFAGPRGETTADQVKALQAVENAGRAPDYGVLTATGMQTSAQRKTFQNNRDEPPPPASTPGTHFNADGDEIQD